MKIKVIKVSQPAVILLLFSAIIVVSGCKRKIDSKVTPQTKPTTQMPFGSENDLALADSLWAIISDEEVGYLTWNSWDEARVEMYEGQSPHGAFLKTYVSPNASGSSNGIPLGAIIVKENYTEDKTLGPLTIMWRIKDYDPDNFDWFWAKYLPDGKVDKNAKGVKLAGRVAKGMDVGCISCHGDAGKELVFTN
ncbi:MAG: hypothetical protein IIA61_02535 [Candidatus Marinimicrobia bacterium]|nr:hypothetical protein [Candidatus Neomarinimicrobiota bacterium]